MKRLLKWIFILSAIAGAGIVVARSIGEQQPLPERVAIFHLTDCKLPCWIGIVPGKTTVGEARRRIREVYAALPGYSVRDELDTDFPSFGVYGGSKLIAVQIIINPEDERFSDATVVESLVIRQPDFYIKGAPLFSEFYGLFGVPSYVIPPSYDSNNFPMLVYDVGRVTVEVDTLPYDRQCQSSPGRIRIHASFVALEIHKQTSLVLRSPTRPITWRGFNKCYRVLDK